MARLDRPDDVLFPVEELAVFAMPRAGHGEGRTPIHGREAIVNTGTGKVLGVVGRDYRLVGRWRRWISPSWRPTTSPRRSAPSSG